MATASESIVLKLVAGMFGAAAGPYLGSLAGQLDKVGLTQLAIDLGNTDIFKAQYITNQGGHVLAGSYLAKVVPGYNPSNPAHLWVLNWMADQLDHGVPAGQVILNALQALDNVPATDPTWGATRVQRDGWYDMAIRFATINGSADASPEKLLDAVRAPVFASADVNGTALVLKYTDLNGLDAVRPPPASAFAVKVGESTREVLSAVVNAANGTVTLTLASAVIASDVVTVAYTDPTAANDVNALQDVVGNDAASMSAKPVTNSTPDLGGPLFASGTVDGDTLVMTFTDPNGLDATHVPAASTFKVTADGGNNKVTAVVVDAAAKTVTLTLDEAVTDAQVVKVAYTDPSAANDVNALQDALGNDANTFEATAVTNITQDTTPPKFDSATVDGHTLVMKFTDSSELQSLSPPDGSAFTVTVGKSADKVTGVEIDRDARTVTLTLESAVVNGDTVTVAYTDPSDGDDLRAIQDAFGNDAPTMSAKEVVNETKDVTSPVFSSATVNGTSMVLNFNELNTLDAESSHLPLATAFAVKVDGKADAVSAVAVNATAKTVTLTLATAVGDGQAVTVAYTDATKDDDTRAIQDLTGNDAPSFGPTAVTNNTADTTAPVFSGATVNGATLVMSYTDLHTLDAGHAPSTSRFTVKADDVANAVTAVSVNAGAKTVTLTLTTPVISTQSVTVAYTDPTSGNDSNAIQDNSGNDAATLAATAVTNNTAADSTAPVFASAAVNGSTLVLTYTEAIALDAAHKPATGAFAVLVDGVPNAVTGVAVDANAKTVTLTLTTAVEFQQVVTVAYTDPTGGNDVNAIQDTSGNDAVTLAATSVTNNTPDTDGPVLDSAEVNGTTLILQFTDSSDLDEDNLPDLSAFGVKVNSTDNVVTDVEVNAAAKTVTLTLTTAVVNGADVVLSYTDPTGGNDANAIQDVHGNDAVSLVGVVVDNITPL